MVASEPTPTPVRAARQGQFLVIPPTGKQVAMSAIEIDRIRDDTVAEHGSGATNSGC